MSYSKFDNRQDTHYLFAIKMNNATVPALRDLLYRIIHGLCSHPEDLTVTAPPATVATDIILIHPHSADYPKIIGKKGRVITGLKHLFAMAGAQFGANIELALTNDPAKGTREPDCNVPYNPFMPPEIISGPLATLCEAVTGEPMRIEVACVGQIKTFQLFPSWAEAISPETLTALHNVFHAYGKAQGAGNVTIECQGVSNPQRNLS